LKNNYGRKWETDRQRANRQTDDPTRHDNPGQWLSRHDHGGPIEGKTNHPIRVQSGKVNKEMRMPGAKPTHADTATTTDPLSGGIAILQNLISASQTYMSGMLAIHSQLLYPVSVGDPVFSAGRSTTAAGKPAGG
jgi:hypothetical protein